MRVALLIALFLSTTVVSVQAQVASSTFNIRLLVGEDTEAPTTPTLLTAVPVSTSQIDLTWTASTDNLIVSGYNVFRDGTPIATTTLTSFSDTSLSPTTTYSYTVRAFDNVPNYSSSSNALATTTLDFPPPPVEEVDDGSNGSVVRIVAEEVTVTPGVSTTSIAIASVRPGRFEIRWGRTTSYELGYVVTSALSSTYRTLLTDLEPGTTYLYEIVGYTPFGNSNIVDTGRFTTLSEADVLPPANVSRFVGQPFRSDVRLSWELPRDPDIAQVRIVRSHLSFPAHPSDGIVLYQGLGSSVVDEGILNEYSPVYYTAFVFDESGNVSSGAITIVYAQDGEPSVSPPIRPLPPASSGGGVSTTSPTSTESSVRSNPPLLPELYEILIIQGKETQSFLDDSIELGEDSPFLVVIPAEAIADNLKSIIATLQDPTDNRKAYAFLLRLNKDQTAYEAMIAPLMVTGESSLTIDVYDFETAAVGQYQKEITFIEGFGDGLNRYFEPEPVDHLSIFLRYLLFFLLLFLILFWFIFVRRRNEDKKR